MLCFQFLATVFSSAFGKGVNFMPEKKLKHKKGGMSLDDTEGWFTALAGKGPDAT